MTAKLTKGKNPTELASELCGMMQESMKDTGIDFAKNDTDIKCAKIAIEIAREENKRNGELTGKYDRILSALNHLKITS